MRSRTILLLATVAALAAPASASASFGHVVAAGESLSSVAAADGVPVSQLAAANGLSSDSQLIAGSTLQIPPQGATVSQAAPMSTGVTAPAAASGDGDADSDDTASTAATSSGESAAGTVSGSSASGGYTVALGDTLSGIAARYGVSVDQLAAANGLDPAGILPAGDVLSLSGGSTAQALPVSTTVTTSAPAVTGGSPGAQPTPETVSASDVGQVAAANGVSPSLAEAIGYQESGFNNNLVSSTGATGVMQIEPGTWNYIGSNLTTPPPLSPTSAQDNIRAGVTLLHSLLNQTGGDPAMAAAGYYQGLQSVQQHGMYSDTQQYVNDVMALRQHFGGP
jgi:N-acetylmuramoyl-L-alanine amidase